MRKISLFMSEVFLVKKVVKSKFYYVTNFRFGKRFDVALLAQSIVMFVCMIFMLEIAVRMNRKHISRSHYKSLIKGDFFGSFWAWHDLKSFLIVLTIFTSFWSFITMALIQFKWYVEALGMVSLLVEASLGAPQLIRNWRRKSTQGMSIPMVLAWLCGDLAKTGYFVATGSPLQFWVCAILQVRIMFCFGLYCSYFRYYLSCRQRESLTFYVSSDNEACEEVLK
ncbi:PQ loop repeat protein [Dictyocaulus viviparus]|uniref:PQ loop repeat protein n=1 Tax=Dictyocaulus viviparus TaxID=29172 RepID=A0A0D8XGN0_DICVI|nr:PQ loop repeat protein [Dictyocaulus viviparus]